MALIQVDSSILNRVPILLFLIYGFSLTNQFSVIAVKPRYIAGRYLWPNATIPYVIDCSIANVFGAIDVLKSAMAAWENRTCIRFVKRTNEQAYLLIRRQKGCTGQIGYRRGIRLLSMGDGCEYKNVIMHELGHVIGFSHEHQRADRDKYIKILWDNILKSRKPQFSISSKKNSYTKLPYDPSSIMHYKFTAFTKSYTLSTMSLRNKSRSERPRPFTEISDLDVQKTHDMYHCSNDGMKNKPRGNNDASEVEIVEAVEVSLISPGWLVTNTRTRIASIKVNNKEMAKNDLGMNVVVFNYLSGKQVRSDSFNLTDKRAGERLSTFIKSTPRRNYFLIVSKVPSLQHLQEARLALKKIGIRLPRYIPYGSSICIVGYKGKENVAVKYVIGTPREKASVLTMNITLPSFFSCKNDVPKCVSIARGGNCRKRPNYYLKVCQKACGSCKKGKSCEDEDPKCEEWAKKQYCGSFASYMLKYCKVSCGVCRKALPARTKAKGNSSQRKRKIVVVDVIKGKVKTTLSKDNNDEEYNRKPTGRRCSDKRKDCPGWAKSGLCENDEFVQKRCWLSCDIKGSCDKKQIKPQGTCSEPFGLGWDRKLKDNSFSASSFRKFGKWIANASNARLYMEDDFKNYRLASWCSKYPPSKTEWLKVDLGKTKRITAVATQGRYRFYEHVKTYKLSYSKNNKTWKYYQENGRDKEFEGNCDHDSPVLNNFDKAIIARYVRFHPIKYFGKICMRLEIYGCKV